MMNQKLKKIAAASVLAALISAIFLFGGVGATAYAAQAALPGDALYSVKTGMEQTRVALARESIEKARLNIQYADRRLDEMLQLVELERYQDLPTAVAEFQAYTARAIETLGTVSIASDPARAKELTAVVAGILTRQSLSMSKLAADLPEAARPALQEALTAFSGKTISQSSSDEAEHSGNGQEFTGTVEEMAASFWIIDGVSYTVDDMTIIEDDIQVGDQVEFYVFTAADGSQSLWKVELDDSGEEMDSSQDDMEDDPMEDSSDDDDDSMEEESSMDDDDHEAEGTVEAIADTSWTIDGVVYQVDPTTIEIEGSIQVGDWVEFHIYTTADGTLALASVELESQDDSHDDSLDDMEDDSYEDDHEEGSQSGSNTPYYDSHDDDHDDDHSGQYDDHDDDDDDDDGGSGDHHDDDDDDDDHGDHDGEGDHDD